MEIKTKQFYKCEVCGSVSTIADKAKRCEESHIKIDEASPIEAEYPRQQYKEYPSKIIVTMQNGAQLDYVRHCIIRKPTAPPVEQTAEDEE